MRNIVLLIVDSLRAASLLRGDLQVPFFRRLDAETLCFRRAHAAECWTLPSHLSMFTGLLPSEHGAHFQTMAYAGSQPTLAERLAGAGYLTALVTRNFVFDGTIDGVTRGFQRLSRPLAPLSRATLAGVLLSLAKPRVRRHIRQTGFFHPRHATTRAFVRTLARSLLPADELALARVLALMVAARRAGRRYFICCNLYDVHAPYPPAADSVLGPWNSPRRVLDNVLLPVHLARLGQHAYLRDGFRASAWTARALRDRYQRAIELMDGKLAAFYGAAHTGGLLEDTLLIVTSDHGEAFGEHGLYLHDASVYETHLHVPLWIRDPARVPETIADVVGTQELFGVVLAGAGQRPAAATILDARYRAARPLAIAEHFYYPHRRDMALRYRQNLLAVIAGDDKFVLRREGPARYDLSRDPSERDPQATTLEAITAAVRRSGAASAVIEATVARLRCWQEQSTAAAPLRAHG